MVLSLARQNTAGSVSVIFLDCFLYISAATWFRFSWFLFLIWHLCNHNIAQDAFTLLLCQTPHSPTTHLRRKQESGLILTVSTVRCSDQIRHVLQNSYFFFKYALIVEFVISWIPGESNLLHSNTFVRQRIIIIIRKSLKMIDFHSVVSVDLVRGIWKLATSLYLGETYV